jgi:hypothetical protein
MDIPRTWATGAQVILNPDFGLIIFREQNHIEFQGEGAPEEPQLMVKNVASVVMPLPVVRELARILTEQLAVMDADVTG